MAATALYQPDRFYAPDGPAPKPVVANTRLEITPEIAALDSPIEWLFGKALGRCLLTLRNTGLWHTVYIPAGEITSWQDFPPLNRQGIVVAEQIEIGTYRADFGCIVKRKGWHLCRYALECDGHQFHERTPEQVRHDKARDRYFTHSGVHTLRYAGSEIIADPEGCAAQALQIVIDLSGPEVRE